MEDDARKQVLVRKRSGVKHKLTSFTSFLDKIRQLFNEQNASLNLQQWMELELRVSKCEGTLQEFEELQTEIEIVTPEETIEQQFAERESFEEKYFKNMSRAKELLASKNAGAENDEIRSASESSYQTNNTNNLEIQAEIKLPTIELPKFNGNFDRWLEFKDTFDSLIHNNVKLGAIQKYHYLRAALEGSAAQVIEALEFSADNYKIAWDLICVRFDNKNLLVYNHMKGLFSMPEVTKEAASIRKLIDLLSKHLRCLNTLNIDTSSWDPFIIYLVTTKLDRFSLAEWEKQRANKTEFPTVEELKGFLQVKADLLETLEHREKEKPNVKDKKPSKRISLVASSGRCNNCQAQHLIYDCPDFLKLSVAQRIEKAKKANLCLNCLRTGHFASRCLSGPCRTCQKRHNSLLHDETKLQSKQEHSTSLSATTHQQVLLSTAQLLVKGNSGMYQKCRAILDSGSQSNFITENACTRLGIKPTKTTLFIEGINKVSSTIDMKCYINAKSMYNNYNFELQCLVLPSIINEQPSQPITILKKNDLNKLQLADPEFDKPGQIDLLIGAEVFWNLLTTERRFTGKNKPVLHNSLLGWIVSGRIGPCHKTTRIACNLSTRCAIDKQLRQFWELEEIPQVSEQSQEQKVCEINFQETTIRKPDGRFVVRIPLKDSTEKLGDSESTALCRLYALERRFKRDKKFQQQYVEFLDEYERLGHMTKRERNNCDSRPTYYLPHHGVINASSTTTKLRVVFDGSAPTTTGWSINDIQAVGPTIQDDLITILIRFRQHRYALVADVKKMYRQIEVATDQRNLQCILWRTDPTKEAMVYELNTVTYGTSAAPFLAIRCLHQLGVEHLESYPESAQIILHDFYVDDLITGGDDINELERIHNELSTILAKGCMELRKWRSNNQQLRFINQEQANDSLILNENENQSTKTLGLQWIPASDTLCFQIAKDCPIVCTKRNILAAIAKIFDPLGLLAPTVITAKIILQKLWQLGLDWDDPVPDELKKSWTEFRKTLCHLNDLKVPRFILTEGQKPIQLHGFCDASQLAYGACVYVRALTSDGRSCTRLVCAKGKVAPLKHMTIPRLELTGALLLARLMDQVVKSLRNLEITCYYWSDSQVTLCWLRTQCNLLLPYVSNRVSQIQSLSDIHSWKYISTKENPADLVSRGVTPKNLLSSQLWWSGPSWLSLPRDQWPSGHFQVKGETPELRKTIVLITTNKEDMTLFKRFSNYSKLVRVISYCFRFAHNCKNKGQKISGPITVQESKTATAAIIRIAQDESFHEEITILRRGGVLPNTSKLLSLAPFVDENHHLRVGGRLSLSNFPYDKTHPYLLSSKHPVSKLILQQEHEKLLHAGPQHLLASVREKFWIIAARNLARSVVRSCIRCIRYRATQLKPIMGSLPKERITPSFPFETTGIDYAGPFTLQERLSRGKRTFKVYLCLFVCFSCKALHLEPVTDLSTDAFLATLKRFIARRGRPQRIYSDNGRNFLGATSQLRELGNFLLENTNPIIDYASSEGMEWHFIPPYSPNFGGLWEAGVKSTKFHLTRVVGNKILCLEDFLTLITQIEGVLNSRPLSVLSSEPNDIQVLTPAHFLIGRSMKTIPEVDLTNINENRLSRFQSLQQLKEQFWKRWSQEYISELQQRSKWKSRQDGIRLDNIVLIKNDNVPASTWQLGRVVALHPGHDDVTRVVSVKTISGVLKRPVNKLCILPLENNEI